MNDDLVPLVNDLNNMIDDINQLEARGRYLLIIYGDDTIKFKKFIDIMGALSWEGKRLKRDLDKFRGGNESTK